MNQQFTVGAFSPFTLYHNNEIPQGILTDIPTLNKGIYGSPNLGEMPFLEDFGGFCSKRQGQRGACPHSFSATITHDFESKVTGISPNPPNTASTENPLLFSMAISSVMA